MTLTIGIALFLFVFLVGATIYTNRSTMDGGLSVMLGILSIFDFVFLLRQLP